MSLPETPGTPSLLADSDWQDPGPVDELRKVLPSFVIGMDSYGSTSGFIGSRQNLAREPAA